MVRCNTCDVTHMRQFCRLFYCFAWFDTVEFNRLPCTNDKMYNDVVFSDRLRHQLTVFGIDVLIVLSRLLHSHIAYETDTVKITATFCRICYCLHDLGIQSSAMIKQQDVRLYSFRWSIPISIDYVWSVGIDRAISTPRYAYCIWNSYIKNHHW